MKLYHGTSSGRLKDFEELNWNTGKGWLYLTDDKETAESYAEMSVEDDESESDQEFEPVILVFDADILQKLGTLGPDWDDAMSAFKSGEYPEYPDQWGWEMSLERLGTCAYQGQFKPALLQVEKEATPLEQLVESLVVRVLAEMDARRPMDMNFDMSFEQWVSAMGGIAAILNEYQVILDDHYYWVKDEIDEDEENWEEAFKERALKEFAIDLENSYHDWQKQWEELQEEEDPIVLFRCVSLKSPKDLRKHKLGIHWTFDYSSAKCHWGTGGDKYIITAEVDFGDIDQPTTMYHNLFPSTGDVEKEVNLLPGSEVKIISLRGPKGQRIDVGEIGTV